MAGATAKAGAAPRARALQGPAGAKAKAMEGAGATAKPAATTSTNRESLRERLLREHQERLTKGDSTQQSKRQKKEGDKD